MKKVTQSGDGYFTNDAEYIVTTVSGREAIKRGDGSYMLTEDDQDAHGIAEALASGERNDSEFIWHRD